jgi:hypothetical protein
MRSDRDGLVTVLDRADAVVEELCELKLDALTTPERLRVLERLERLARRLPVPSGLRQSMSSSGLACSASWRISPTESSALSHHRERAN